MFTCHFGTSKVWNKQICTDFQNVLDVFDYFEEKKMQLKIMAKQVSQVESQRSMLSNAVYI